MWVCARVNFFSKVCILGTLIIVKITHDDQLPINRKNFTMRWRLAVFRSCGAVRTLRSLRLIPIRLSMPMTCHRTGNACVCVCVCWCALYACYNENACECMHWCVSLCVCACAFLCVYVCAKDNPCSPISLNYTLQLSKLRHEINSTPNGYMKYHAWRTQPLASTWQKRVKDNFSNVICNTCLYVHNVRK